MGGSWRCRVVESPKLPGRGLERSRISRWSGCAEVRWGRVAVGGRGRMRWGSRGPAGLVCWRIGWLGTSGRGAAAVWGPGPFRCAEPAGPGGPPARTARWTEGYLPAGVAPWGGGAGGVLRRAGFRWRVASQGALPVGRLVKAASRGTGKGAGTPGRRGGPAGVHRDRRARRVGTV